MRLRSTPVSHRMITGKGKTLSTNRKTVKCQTQHFTVLFCPSLSASGHQTRGIYWCVYKSIGQPRTARKVRLYLPIFQARFSCLFSFRTAPFRFVIHSDLIRMSMLQAKLESIRIKPLRYPRIVHWLSSLLPKPYHSKGEESPRRTGMPQAIFFYSWWKNLVCW